MVWISVAERYNEALVALAEALLPNGHTFSTFGSHILIEHPSLASAVSIEGFTLHYGLVLLAVLVLAAVGIGIVARVGWLLGLAAGAFLLHAVGVALLARSLVWATGGSTTLIFGLFAVFWGLLPAVIGGAWCLMYWLPRASGRPPGAPSSLERLRLIRRIWSA